MNRAEYECLKAVQFGMPLSSSFGVWMRLVNEGWIAKPAHLARMRLAMSQFVITDEGTDALDEFEAAS